jgi:chlorobactene glucosyltransferase
MTWLLAAPWLLVLAVVAYRYKNRRPHLRDYPPQASGPKLSVIIPARNESANVESCVRSVMRAGYQPLEIIVVDDHSTDDTAAIVQRLARTPEAQGRVRLVRAADLPAGWFGKQWAMIQGYRAATGELVLFTDADTHHEPDLIPRGVRALGTEHAHLVSVIPRQEMKTFWERLIQPQVFLALQSRVGDLRNMCRTRLTWNAMANGQFIMTSRAAYEQVGTHEVVHDTVAEDVALAQTYVRKGLDIFLLHAAEYMSTRMYRSLHDIIAGWSKNLALGAPMVTPPIRPLRRAIPYLMWLPSLFWIAPPLWWALVPVWTEPAMAATTLSFVTWLVVYREERAPLAYAVLYPLGALMTAYIMIRSAVRGGRKVEWKERTYRGSGSHLAQDPVAAKRRES